MIRCSLVALALGGCTDLPRFCDAEVAGPESWQQLPGDWSGAQWVDHPDGSVLLARMVDDDIHTLRLERDGTPGEPRTIPVPGIGALEGNIGAAAGPDGSWLLMWSLDFDGAYAVRLHASGEPAGEVRDLDIADDTLARPVMAWDGEKFGVLGVTDGDNLSWATLSADADVLMAPAEANFRYSDANYPLALHWQRGTFVLVLPRVVVGFSQDDPNDQVASAAWDYDEDAEWVADVQPTEEGWVVADVRWSMYTRQAGPVESGATRGALGVTLLDDAFQPAQAGQEHPASEPHVEVTVGALATGGDAVVWWDDRSVLTAALLDDRLQCDGCRATTPPGTTLGRVVRVERDGDLVVAWILSPTSDGSELRRWEVWPGER
jgi:hypothetical protein